MADSNPGAESLLDDIVKIHEQCPQFRILVMGRSNAGKTTILQKVCNTTEQPMIFSPEGDEVWISVYVQPFKHCIAYTHQLLDQSRSYFTFLEGLAWSISVSDNICSSKRAARGTQHQQRDDIQKQSWVHFPRLSRLRVWLCGRDGQGEKVLGNARESWASERASSCRLVRLHLMCLAPSAPDDSDHKVLSFNRYRPTYCGCGQILFQ